MKNYSFSLLSEGKYMLIVNGVVSTFIEVEPGTFEMGVEGDKHSETIKKGFLIAETPVTVELWNAVFPDSRRHTSTYPVNNVSWEDICEFMERIQEMTKLPIRLPSAKEREFAARGGIKSKGYTYAGSNKLSDVAYYFKNEDGSRNAYQDHSCRVKEYSPNELGLYDMTGNVCEYTCDVDEDDDEKHVIQGASWYNLQRKHFQLGQFGLWDGSADRGIGFRLVI